MDWSMKFNVKCQYFAVAGWPCGNSLKCTPIPLMCSFRTSPFGYLGKVHFGVRKPFISSGVVEVIRLNKGNVWTLAELLMKPYLFMRGLRKNLQLTVELTSFGMGSSKSFFGVDSKWAQAPV